MVWQMCLSSYVVGQEDKAIKLHFLISKEEMHWFIDGSLSDGSSDQTAEYFCVSMLESCVEAL